MELLKKDYFELFNLQKIFNIDLNLLNSHYLTLQNKYHPDKNQSFLPISCFINIGYETLKKPLTRAIYLLKLKNIDLENEIVIKAFTKKNLLNKMWKLHKYLEHISDNEKKIKLFINKLEEQKNKIINIISQKIDKNLYNEAAYSIIELKYLTKLIKNCQKW